MSRENGPSSEEMGFSAEEKIINKGREHNAERAHAEARLISAKDNEKIDSLRSSARIFKAVGEEGQATKAIGEMNRTIESSSEELRQKAKDILISAATKKCRTKRDLC